MTQIGQATLPGWITDAVCYQIFVERYANGLPAIDPEGAAPWGTAPSRGNFMGGDLRGIEQHLDHIAELGANLLYLTPIFEADTNHRYDTADYLRIDHRLGDLADFRSLVKAAHARGIRIVLDAVFNHVGEGHWAFRHVYANADRSPYVNWFQIERFPIVRDPAPNYATFAGCPYLPKLNHFNPEVREHLYEVARHWLAEGIDGWRLDVPFEINHEFWRGFRDVVKGLDPQAYIVGEVWETATEWLHGDQFDGTMNYPFRTAVLRFAKGESTASGLSAELQAVQAATPAWAQQGMLNLLGSHDTARVSHELHADRFALKTAVALLLTAPGVPMIYYGDEIGLAGGEDPDNRRCMQWEESQWDQDLASWYRTLIQLRHARPSLRSREDDISSPDDDVVIRQRGTGDDAVSVVINRASHARSVAGISSDRDLLTGTRLERDSSGNLVVPPEFIGVLAQ